MHLSAFALDVYSQFGEDGVTRQIFFEIGIRHFRCGEVGASDGLSLSNTAQWWRDQGWQATLVEADPQRFAALAEIVTERCETYNVLLTPDNINEVFSGPFDLLSIDVDGDDYFLFEAMETRPRVLLIEINHTVPWWMSVRPAAPGSRFGASAAAMVELAKRKKYTLVGRTGCNLVFVSDEEVSGLAMYESELGELFGEEWLTILATDYDGRPRLLGWNPPWGLQDEQSTEELIVGGVE